MAVLADPAFRAAAMRRARRSGARRTEAEDAVQEAAVRALRYRQSLRPGAPAEPWFLQIVTRVVYDAESHRRRDVMLLRYAARAHVTERLDFEDSFTLREAVRALPAGQGRVVVLHDVDGLTTREIASLDGVPHSTVRTRLRRGRLALRSALVEEGYGT